jgi:hypothetical protein
MKNRFIKMFPFLLTTLYLFEVDFDSPSDRVFIGDYVCDLYKKFLTLCKFIKNKYFSRKEKVISK